MGIGQGDNLAAVRGISQDFLVSGHGRVEDNLANGFALCPNGNPVKDRSILQRKHSWFRQQQSPEYIRLASHTQNGRTTAFRSFCPPNSANG
jgi:hypothetical protein